MDREVALEDLQKALEDVRAGTTRGRVVINVVASQ
jgi:D-arabinose 1-dehydrogenase-like Zn-dependent alcohol dehydrogenase